MKNDEPDKHFEALLRQQSQAEPDAAWRDAILETAMDAIPATPAIGASHRSPSSFRKWLREWLPMPLRIPLAAAWLLIGFFTINTSNDRLLTDRQNRTTASTVSSQSVVELSAFYYSLEFGLSQNWRAEDVDALDDSPF